MLDGRLGTGDVRGQVRASSSQQRLSEIREALLNLHKALMLSERERYQKVVGPIQSPNHFLQLLTNDPWFAWLHPLSEIIVTMDEALENKEEPLTEAMVEALVGQSRVLLAASEDGKVFGGHYREALQDDPDVVMAHAAAIKLVGRPKPEPSS